MLPKVSLLLLVILVIGFSYNVVTAGDVAILNGTRLVFGGSTGVSYWSMEIEMVGSTGVLVFRDLRAAKDSRIAFWPGSYTDLNGRGGHVP